MDKVLKLKQRMLEVTKEARDLQAAIDADNGRPPSEDEAKQLKTWLDEAEFLAADIERRERIEAANARLVTPEPRKTSPPAIDRTYVDPMRESAVIRPGAPLRAFKPQKGETHQQMLERAYKCGQWLLGQVLGNERAMLWCRDHGMEIRTHQEAVNKYGGFLVPDEFDTTIIDLREQYGVARRYAKVIPMSRDHMVIPRRTGGLTAYAVGEAETITESTKTWDQVALTAKKWGCLSRYSSEVAEDAVISLADDLAQEMAYAFANKEDDCLFNGDGTSTYHGITGVLAQILANAAAYHTAAGAAGECDVYSEVGADDITGIMAKVPAYVYARGTPKWYVATVGVAAVFQRLLLAAGGNTMMNVAGGVPTTYAGFEVVPVSAWACTTSTDFSGLNIMLFGDLAMAAALGDRRGTTVKVSGDRYIESDEMVIVGTTRFDINVHDVGDASTAGPLVGLVGV